MHSGLHPFSGFSIYIYFFHASRLSSSVSLSYFIITVPMRECLGKHKYMGSPFPMAILNMVSSFCEKR